MLMSTDFRQTYGNESFREIFGRPTHTPHTPHTHNSKFDPSKWKTINSGGKCFSSRVFDPFHPPPPLPQLKRRFSGDLLPAHPHLHTLEMPKHSPCCDSVEVGLGRSQRKSRCSPSCGAIHRSAALALLLPASLRITIEPLFCPNNNNNTHLEGVKYNYYMGSIIEGAQNM